MKSTAEEEKILKDIKSRINQETIKSDSQNESGDLPPDFLLQCFESNELGDGLMFSRLYRGKFVFDTNSGTWFVWQGNRWAPDYYNEVPAAVEGVALQFAALIKFLGEKLSASLAGDTGEAVGLQKKIGLLSRRIKKLRSDSGRKSCLIFAHTNPINPLSVHSKDFDKDLWLLACKNGVIDLKTGECSPGKPSQNITKQCQTVWEGISADKQAWIDALNDIFDGDQEMISFLQRLYGYAMTGDISEHVFIVHYGAGRNGKGLIIEMINKVLGSYAGTLPAEMLLASKNSSGGNGVSPELMRLKNLRLAIASETDEGRKIAASKVKWLTGGDTLTGRNPYDRALTEFSPTHLLVLLTNHKPEAPGNDFAFWERCFLIHHKIKFVKRKPSAPNEREADKNLYRKLEKCWPGILAWLVEGCLLWQQQGLNPPEVVTRATKAYQEDEDIIGQFLEAVCEFHDSYKATAKGLYTAFKIWYIENINEKERYVPSQKAFGKKLLSTERFERRKSGGYFRYLGLRINSSYVNRVPLNGTPQKMGTKGP